MELAHPVPADGGEARILIQKTYEDAKSYHPDGGDIRSRAGGDKTCRHDDRFTAEVAPTVARDDCAAACGDRSTARGDSSAELDDKTFAHED